MGLKGVGHFDDRFETTLLRFMIPTGKELLPLLDVRLAPKVHEPQPVVVGPRRLQMFDFKEFIDLRDALHVEFIGVEKPNVARVPGPIGNFVDGPVFGLV